jgi:hypothetical protein
MKGKIMKILVSPLLPTMAIIACLLAIAPAVAAQDKESATGHGTYAVGPKQKRQFSFSAIKHSDGTVTGNAIIQNPAFAFRGQLDITCLRVTPGSINPVTGDIGTRADIGGTLTKSNDPGLPEGTRGFFTVFDHGEPGKDRDTISPVFFDFVVPASACENILGDVTAPSNQVQIPIEAGNIQVRPDAP